MPCDVSFFRPAVAVGPVQGTFTEGLVHSRPLPLSLGETTM